MVSHRNSAAPTAAFMRFRSVALAAVVVLLALPAGGWAQPFDRWLAVAGTGQTADNSEGFAQFPDNPAFDLKTAITIEGWVNVETPNPNQDCRSFIGKGYQTSYWVGVCAGGLRSYLRGVLDRQTGGVIPSDEWTHFAVTFDGTNRKHYINGELVATFPETAPITTNTAPLEIGSDADWAYSPKGDLNLFRLWNVALSQDQIRTLLNVKITAPMNGLVAEWIGQNDVLGQFNGTLKGAVTISTPRTNLLCVPSSSGLCLLDHFAISTLFRQGAVGTAEATAQTVNFTTAASGLFWFFSDDNWEVTVKMVDGCGTNQENWTFITSDTSLFFRTTVTDMTTGAQKIYFNYPSLTPFSILDTSSMACGN
jgi:hypothetical protein